MNVVIYTSDIKLINEFNKLSKNSFLFKEKNTINISNFNNDDIYNGKVDAFIFDIVEFDFQEKINAIKSKFPLIPILVIGALNKLTKISNADMLIPVYLENSNETNSLCHIIFSMLINYNKNFEKTRKLLQKSSEIIEIENYKYDPLIRSLYRDNKELKKLSQKEGGIFEELAFNFGKVVKKEVILEKIWKRSDYFTGRSMDVYVTHLRSILKQNNINMNIRNISGAGLILEKK